MQDTRARIVACGYYPYCAKVVDHLGIVKYTTKDYTDAWVAADDARRWAIVRGIPLKKGFDREEAPDWVTDDDKL